MKKQFIFQSCVFLLTLLWIYASVSKLANFELTKSQMQSQLFGSSSALFLAWTVPLSELVLGIMLAVPKTLKAGLVTSLVFLIVFTIYIAGGLLRLYPRVPCSCGGVIGRLGWGNHLIFNLFFILVSIIALKTYHERRPSSINNTVIIG